MSLKKRAKQTISETNGIISELDIDQITTNGITIRCGNRKLELSVIKNEKMSVEDEMKEEFRLKLRERLQEIKIRLNKKIEEMAEFTTQIRIETERKERELQKQLDQAVPMPQILYKHAQAGLSIVKGRGKGNLIWLVQGLYIPLFVDEIAIETRYAKKLITPIIVQIKTEEKYIKSVTTHKPLGLEFFSHYHQLKPDCWGNWKWSKQWKTPEDILNCARQAESVLENINTGSVANSAPAGLPRLDTLKRHVTSKKLKKATLDTDMTRIGANTSTRINELGDIWES